jgi:F-type H+-transporting ATPase subunit epsilon
MEFELLTLSGAKFTGEAKQVNLTTVDGRLGILPHHEPLVAKVVAGSVEVKPAQGEPQVFAIYGGLIEVTAANRVRLMADEAEHAEELVASEIEEALKRAEDMRAKAKDKTELSNAQAMVDREGVRLGVARMRRREHRRPEGPAS